ncbi:sulfurtransferase-like selenium metabolism protein YedF [Campylobacter sp. MIT 99-7217]|uniref:sulfurtransferase-like selenium metabolism protein YedF n=1 Tax=Campylobacter sp. MIT 99-7217 TaxID=535091 RepID=UPI00115C4046|nr:sulfurtransferase-like selenium metabolism protein YedF [Campylobacter sp. MIT 99-7217]TQR30339.1 sulfurtransferase-like selenium metabolism protein YedF [Campylobacter sp. MIT 99-7217]
MQIDCRNLDCPKPVIETKNALEKLNEGEKLEILLNSQIAKTNVLKFLKTQNLEAKLSENGDEITISTQKVSNSTCTFDKQESLVLFLKTDKVGDGELGKKLFVGFLNTLKDMPQIPSKILCVNDSVLVNSNPDHPAHKIMSELENLGVEIISCGTCLEFFGKTKELKIGNIGNAYEILGELCGKAKIISL